MFPADAIVLAALHAEGDLEGNGADHVHGRGGYVLPGKQSHHPNQTVFHRQGVAGEGGYFFAFRPFPCGDAGVVENVVGYVRPVCGPAQ